MFLSRLQMSQMCQCGVTLQCLLLALKGTSLLCGCDRVLQGLIATAEGNMQMRMYDGLQRVLGTQD